jgi:hypothetical protein
MNGLFLGDTELEEDILLLFANLIVFDTLNSVPGHL